MPLKNLTTGGEGHDCLKLLVAASDVMHKPVRVDGYAGTLS
jgi:hypothetical protein